MVIGCLGEGANRQREKEHIAKARETDQKQMSRTWREMLKTVLAESENMIKKVLSNIVTVV